jgi:hypothetical protein
MTEQAQAMQTSVQILQESREGRVGKGRHIAVITDFLELQAKGLRL